MRIHAIDVQNFLGARDVAVRLGRPILLVAGANGAGKSSVRDAVALALTADLGRVNLKKHVSNLVTDSGAKSATVSVVTDGREYGVQIGSTGTYKDSGGNSMPEALRYLVDPSRFCAVSSDERRELLYDLMDVRADANGVRDRLLNRRVAQAHVDLIIPMLRAGFPAAAQEAAGHARDAKADWKAITGEVWGSQKADGWRAEIPHSAVDATERAKLLQIEIATADESLQAMTAEMGGLQQQSGAAKRSAEHVAQLREQAGKYARISDKLARDRKDLADWKTTVEDLQRTQAIDTRPQCACPECGALLEIVGEADLRTSLPRPTVDPSGYPEKIAEAVKARDLMASAVAHGERDLEAADRAAQELKRLEDAGLDKAPDQAVIDELGGKIGTLRGRITALRADLDAAQALSRAAAEAGQKTEKAAKHHANVVAWSNIAQLLGTDGIPAELLNDAIGPFNARLLDGCDMTGWPGVQVQPDMSVTYGGRPLSLCSESEQWRAHALLAEAISHVSGIKFFCLDRVDVLDLASRSELLAWLDTLAAEGELDTALLFATLKAAPARLPDTMQALWIENGVAVAQAAKEAA